MVPERSNRGTWTLAHLLQEEGEEMGWLYDCECPLVLSAAARSLVFRFGGYTPCDLPLVCSRPGGDNWAHVIKVSHVVFCSGAFNVFQQSASISNHWFPFLSLSDTDRNTDHRQSKGALHCSILNLDLSSRNPIRPWCLSPGR